jgi:hypothetical protein
VPSAAWFYGGKGKQFFDEIYNFAEYNRRVYGLFYAGRTSKIAIRRLGPTQGDEQIDSVNVIWVARNPTNSRDVNVVGWYANATVYKTIQPAPGGAKRSHPHQAHEYGFLMEANSSDVFAYLQVKEHFGAHGPSGHGNYQCMVLRRVATW